MVCLPQLNLSNKYILLKIKTIVNLHLFIWFRSAIIQNERIRINRDEVCALFADLYFHAQDELEKDELAL